MSFTLHNGYKMPKIAVGTYKIKDPNVLTSILEASINIGYTHIDTAKIYENEEVIGKWIKKNNRKKLFITTKLWNDDHDNVSKALSNSLEKLETNYIDLYLVHWPVNVNGIFDLEKVWKQMERLVIDKKALSIGVSNFGINNLTKLLKMCTIKPAVNQIEVHPLWPQTELIQFCKDNNIQVQAYSPFGSDVSGEQGIMNNPTIQQIAKKYKVAPQQVVLSYLVGEGLVVIPRTSSIVHLEENIKIIPLDSVDIDAIKQIKTRRKFIDPVSFGDGRFE